MKYKGNKPSIKAINKMETSKADIAMDKKKGIKENSKKDKQMDSKLLVKAKKGKK